MIVCKRFKIDAAHFLPNYNGKCKDLHGHCWRVEIGIKGFVNPETGMVVDFNELKAIVEDEIVEKLDHKLLNDIIDNPTAERIAVWIYMGINRKISEVEKSSYELLFVRIWETEDSYAEYPG